VQRTAKRKRKAETGASETSGISEGFPQREAFSANARAQRANGKIPSIINVVKLTMPTIGIDARMLGPEQTGIGRYIENLFRELLRIDGKNRYVLFVRPEAIPLLPFSSDRVKIVPVDIHWYSWREQIVLPRIFLREKLDLLHVPHFNVSIFYPGKFIVTIHDVTHLSFPKDQSSLKRFGFRLTFQRAVARAERVIAVSNYTKDEIRKHFRAPEKKIAVIYEGAHHYKRSADHQSPVTNRPYILYVGVWREHKNIVGLLQAFALLRTRLNPAPSKWGARSDSETRREARLSQRRQPNKPYQRRPAPQRGARLALSGGRQLHELQLVLVGKEDERYPQVRRAWEQLDLWEHIVTPGFVDEPMLATLYEKAELVVVPSFLEGFGFVGLEALRHETPVVASNTGALPEVLGEAAEYFSPDNPSRMALSIERVLQNLMLRRALIKKGRKVLMQYSWERAALETLKLYEEILKKQRVKSSSL